MKAADVMTHSPRFIVVTPIIVMALCLVFSGGMAVGQTVRTWDGNGNSEDGGNWSEAANWSSDDVPDTAAEYATTIDPVVSGTRPTVIVI